MDPDSDAQLAEAWRELEREKARIGRIAEFGRRIAGLTDAEELGETLLAELAALTAADAGTLTAFDGEEPETLASFASPEGGTSGEEIEIALDQADTRIGLALLARASGSFDPAAVAFARELAPQGAATLSGALALRSTRARASVSRAVLDATPDAIALLDRRGKTLLENPPMQSVRRALVESVRAPGGGFRTRVSVQGADPEAEVRDELQLRGTGRVFARYATPVRDEHGATIGRLVVLREVTGEREAERLKDEFFALVSHELRTPLTSIIGYLELLLDPEEPLAPDHRRYLAVVQRNATRLLRLVADLLFAAQVEAGTLSLSPTIVSLDQVVADAVDAARPRAEAKKIALRVEIEHVEPTRADRDRLGQVLDNLITNAVKFTPADGAVLVRLLPRDGHALLEVTDTGPGIPEAEQGRLFERFFRAASATRDAIPGVGLGLTIVKGIAEAHGGRVEVESAEDEGTTFRVSLPLRS